MAQPNILLLMPDQWRFDWDGLARPHIDSPPLHLPHIAQLRAQGTTFPHGAVVPAPVCAPSRSCMASLREYDLAGTATNSANDFRADEIPTYFSALQRAGYHTMTTGKDDLTKATQLGFHLGYDTRNASNTYHARELGFSDSIRFSGKMDVLQGYPKPHEPYGYHLNARTVALENGTRINAFRAHRACLGNKADAALCQRSTYLQSLYEDDWTAAQAVTLLERAPANVPWFLWVSFPGPHPPFAVTAGMAAGEPGREAYPRPMDSKSSGKCAARFTGEPSHARDRCNYAAEMEHLDRLFGTVLDAVRARGHSVMRDTIVCFFSDHGEMLNDHDDVDKSKPWQAALNVPLVCAGPGIRHNASVVTPMATVDIGATMLDYANATPFVGMTARSFRGLLEGAEPRTRNRTVVLSGLQSYDFGAEPCAVIMVEEGDTEVEYEEGEAGADGGTTRSPFNFRLAVAELEGPPLSTYKFVCCQGACPGAPTPVGPPGVDNYTRLLFDTLADPFDMIDLKTRLPHVAETLRAALPTEHGFSCGRL